MPNTYQLIANLHDPGGNFVANVWHYSLSESGAGTPFEYAQALLNQWTSTLQTKFLKLLGNDTILDFITAKRVSGTGGPSAFAIIQAIGGGAHGSETAGLAADVQWQTASGNNRPGHTYIAPVPQQAWDAGSWVTPFTTDVAAWILQMKASMTLSGGLGTADFGVFTRKGKIFNGVKEGQLLPKPTMLNKRTVPVI